MSTTTSAATAVLNLFPPGAQTKYRRQLRDHYSVQSVHSSRLNHAMKRAQIDIFIYPGAKIRGRWTRRFVRLNVVVEPVSHSQDAVARSAFRRTHAMIALRDLFFSFSLFPSLARVSGSSSVCSRFNIIGHRYLFRRGTFDRRTLSRFKS